MDSAGPAGVRGQPVEIPLRGTATLFHRLPTVALESRYAPSHEPLGQPFASLRVPHTAHRPDYGFSSLFPFFFAPGSPSAAHRGGYAPSINDMSATP